MKFMAMVCAEFLARHNPVSTMANPACMNMTRKPADQHPHHIDRIEIVCDAIVQVRRSEFGGVVALAIPGGGRPDACSATGRIRLGVRGILIEILRKTRGWLVADAATGAASIVPVASWASAVGGLKSAHAHAVARKGKVRVGNARNVHRWAPLQV